MPAKSPRGRHARSTRFPTWARIAVTGVLLGIVVVVAGALMNRPGATTPALTGTVETTAQVSVPATTTPSVSTTSTPSVTTSSTDTSTTDSGNSANLPTDAFEKSMPDVGALLPKRVAGYVVGQVETNTVSAIVPLEPTTGGPQGKATVVVLTVLDKKSIAAAQAYVESFQRGYPKDLSAVTIGTLSGRFGTDGAHLAAAVFSRGRYAFEVVATVTRGAPLDIRPYVLQAAAAFGATKTAP